MDKWDVTNRLNPKIVWIIILCIDLILVFLNKSTFDDGDSVLHFLQAHQAAYTPHLFLDMWAKPIFILLAWPFASFGWWGMKLFNTFCIFLSTFFAYNLFIQLKLKQWWAIPLCLGAPAYFLVQSSGLTEPLFTVFLMAIIYLEYQNKTVFALLLLSFLPFIRAEGWIIMLMFSTYLIFAKKWIKLPYIAVGTILYGIVGILFLGDFLFMFNENPYNGVEAKFGSGNIFHYLIQLPYIIGLPIFILVCLGLIRGIQLFITNRMELKEVFLVYGFSVGYILAQSLFWRFGLFHSFGMTRVLIVIIPLLAIIAYRGIEWLSMLVPTKNVNYIFAFYLLLILTFPFTKNKMGFKIEKSYKLSTNQILITNVADWMIGNNLDKKPFYSNAYYLPMVLHKHLETTTECSNFNLLHKRAPEKGSLLIWDSYFAVTDAEITDAFIQNNFEVTLLKEFNNADDSKPYTIKVYSVIK